MMRKRVGSFTLAMAMVLPLAACGQNTAAAPAPTAVPEVTEETAQTADTAALVEAYRSAVDESYAYGIAETLAYDEAYLSNALGWRTAGSDAEHAAADYIAAEMEAIGLEVEKVPVTVDKWQFNDASLTVEGTDIAMMPASYAASGTDAEGITAELVDLGTGTAAEYEGVDVTGKIVLAGVDQWNTAWIDQYLNEAALHGAAAIVTYDVGGYATYSDDMINMQDICSEDVLPCVSISKNQYNELAAALAEGHTTATLTVDNVVEPDSGTSYNVVGRLKGRSSEQQILVAGHYDVYFNGFQDDSCAVGLVMAMAKGLVDASYQPENDILFIAHGSEEWGALGTQFDWTTGAWEMINSARPDWAGKTLALVNFELPAFYDGMAEGYISCVPEFASLTKELVEDSGLIAAPVNDVYPEGISGESVDTNTMEDGVSYRGSGVPYFINIPGTQDGENGWIEQRYHTVADDRDTYNADVMQTNLNTFGALVIYLDQTPALPLDLAATCDDLAEALDADLLTAAGGDADAYTAGVDALRTAAEAHSAKIADLNTRFAAAQADGADEAALDALRAEGRELNAKTLAAFRSVQDNFIGIMSSSDVVIKHIGYQANLELLDGVITALENGELGNDDETGALDLAWQLNAGTEFGYYNFSKETNARARAALLESQNPGNVFWATGKGYELADTSDATVALLEKAESGNTDFTAELTAYRAAYARQQELLVEVAANETDAMQALADELAA